MKEFQEEEDRGDIKRGREGLGTTGRIECVGWSGRVVGRDEGMGGREGGREVAGGRGILFPGDDSSLQFIFSLSFLLFLISPTRYIFTHSHSPHIHLTENPFE